MVGTRYLSSSLYYESMYILTFAISTVCYPSVHPTVILFMYVKISGSGCCNAIIIEYFMPYQGLHKTLNVDVITQKSVIRD
jgi:hypothetical protein